MQHNNPLLFYYCLLPIIFLSLISQHLEEGIAGSHFAISLKVGRWDLPWPVLWPRVQMFSSSMSRQITWIPWPLSFLRWLGGWRCEGFVVYSPSIMIYGIQKWTDQNYLPRNLVDLAMIVGYFSSLMHLIRKGIIHQVPSLRGCEMVAELSGSPGAKTFVNLLVVAVQLGGSPHEVRHPFRIGNS